MEENNEPQTQDAPQKSEETTTQQDEGNQPQATNIVERASIERQKLEKTLSEIQVERKRLEELYANLQLGGRTEGGIAPKKEEEISNKDYAKNALAGKIPKK